MRSTDEVQKLHTPRKPLAHDSAPLELPSRSIPIPHRRTSNASTKCKFCGQEHKFQEELCPAYGRTCKKCKRMNHFAIMCSARSENLKVTDTNDDFDEILALQR